MAKVILDAGHGGSDAGEYYKGRREKNDDLRLTLEIGELLQRKGIEVGYTRTSDNNISQLQRVAIANDLGGDLLVSIHRLFGRRYSRGPGLENFVNKDDEASYEAANIIGQELLNLNIPSYSIIDRKDIPLINDTDMPAVMLGIGYMKSDEDNEFFDNNFEAIAKTVADGIEDALKNMESGESVSKVNLKSDKIGINDCCNDDSRNNERRYYHYRIQVGLFRNYNNALNLQMRLINQGYMAEIFRQGDFYAVHVGDFEEMDDAVRLERILRISGYNTLLVAV
jgi:N-acetylmuramoyl-L-alanine amidase